jgi:hypothetical protein
VEQEIHTEFCKVVTWKTDKEMVGFYGKKGCEHVNLALSGSGSCPVMGIGICGCQLSGCSRSRNKVMRLILYTFYLISNC